MATQVITVNTMTLNAGTHFSGGTVEGTMTVDVGGKTSNVFLHAASGGTAGTITIFNGVNDDQGAFRSSLGTTSYLIPANVDMFITLESARFCDNNGIINIHVVGAADTVLTAYRLPANA